MKVIVNDIKFKVIADSDNEFLVSTADVSNVFGVGEPAIRKQKSRGEYREGRHYVTVTNRHSRSNTPKTMWTKKSIVRLGYYYHTRIYVSKRTSTAYHLCKRTTPVKGIPPSL